ncbi:MAG: enoyl-CoA hydratase/isomerase family protein [Desulfohalobiaceae bacterium]|nr:enoyl-CoA hydratase/isomerase family protein [Desulfohalobiaceae bacterium]
MNDFPEADASSPVLLERGPAVWRVTLNRPGVINSLNPEMVQRLIRILESARTDPDCGFLLLDGAGDRGFCAGGDIRYMADRVRQEQKGDALYFLSREYRLDALVHDFPKPVVVLATGVTMGGGLGLAAGADFVAATESTRMAMPESRIGFFPDVGATGWLHRKCPPGYPEFLGLTGYELRGRECVRVGLATHCLPASRLGELISDLGSMETGRTDPAGEALKERIRSRVGALALDPGEDRDMDAWVRDYFADLERLGDLSGSLRQCSTATELCNHVFRELEERSPTALVLTLMLLRRNKGRDLQEVFHTDLRAAELMLSHPDFLEGVRARIMDKDQQPRWRPSSIEDAGLAGLGDSFMLDRWWD